MIYLLIYLSSYHETGLTQEKTNLAAQLAGCRFGVQINTHGLPVEDVGWGSGHQSFFLFQMLHLLDTNYGRFFGWKQATVWGIEESDQLDALSAILDDVLMAISGEFVPPNIG